MSDEQISHDRGAVDEEHHGWAPDAAGTGPAKDRAVEGHKKAFEANPTQDEAAGAARQGPDLTPEGTGESTTRRGEDVAGEEGKERGRQDTGTQGQSDRPVGQSDARDSTGVDPQNPIDEEAPRLGTGDQGG
jgi:hypothetical protein